jgi:hypothetical protein
MGTAHRVVQSFIYLCLSMKWLRRRPSLNQGIHASTLES